MGIKARPQPARHLVYSGNPRHGGTTPTTIDLIVVIRAAITALGNTPMQLVMTTGYQDLPAELGGLPSNIHHAA